MPISLRRRTRRPSPEPAPAPSLGALSLPDLTAPLVDTDHWPPPVPPVPSGHVRGGSGGGGGERGMPGMVGLGISATGRRDSGSASLSTSVPKDARLNGQQSSFGKPGVGSPWGAKRWTQSATSMHGRSGSGDRGGRSGGGHSRHGSGSTVTGGHGHQRQGSSSSGYREHRECGGAGYGPAVYGTCGGPGGGCGVPPVPPLPGVVPESVASCSARDSQSTINLSGIPGMGESTTTLPFGDSTLSPYSAYGYGAYGGSQTFPRSPTLGSSTYPSAESLSLLSKSRASQPQQQQQQQQQNLPSSPRGGRAPSLVKDVNGASPEFHRPFAQNVVSPPKIPTALPGTVSARKRAQKRVAALTIMVAGPTGSGKTS